MKIIAAANRDTFIVEMTEREIVRAAGYSYSSEAEWSKVIGGSGLKVGTVINVNAAFDFHHRIESKQKEAKNAANIMRALAEMMENGLPDVVLPPSEKSLESGDL